MSERPHNVEPEISWRRAPMALFFATVGGIGYLPGGPGTYAAALATPLIIGISAWSLGVRLGLLVFAIVLSVGWCERAGIALEEPDSRRIVLDEVIGVWTALVWFPSLGWLAALVGLVLFRVVDIWKPPPCNRLHGGDEGGLEVVGDDVVAGLMVAPVVLVFVLL